MKQFCPVCGGERSLLRKGHPGVCESSYLCMAVLLEEATEFCETYFASVPHHPPMIAYGESP
jgi:hypothetical protein